MRTTGEDFVYIKFGKHHGKKARITGHGVKNGYPAYLLKLESGEVITKKQKNTVRMLNK